MMINAFSLTADLLDIRKFALLGSNMEGVMRQWIISHAIELRQTFKAPSDDNKMARNLKVRYQFSEGDFTDI